MKLFFTFCYFLLPFCLAKVELGEFFPHGESSGDICMLAKDDGYAEVNPWPYEFPFVNRREKIFWINSNGDISFAREMEAFAPFCGSLDENSRMIAGFWTDMDNEKGGSICYRQTTDRRFLQKAAADVIKRYPAMIGIKLKWLFIATWEDVPPHSWPEGSMHAPEGNTFQVVLATDGKFSFSIHYYNNIGYSDGHGSSSHAKVAFDYGDKKNFIQVDGSCSSRIASVVDRTNMDVPGKWVFRVDNTNISTAPCENDGSYDNGKTMLRVMPSFVDTLGYVPVAFQGPCFPTTAKATCTFDDNVIGPIQTTGTITVPAHGIPTVQCLAPTFFGLGRTAVQVTVTEPASSSSITYSAFLSVASLPPNVNVSVLLPGMHNFNDSGLLLTKSSLIKLQWQKDAWLLQQTSYVDVTMSWFDANKRTMVDLVTLARNLPNIGAASILYDGNLPGDVDKEKLARSFLVISVSPSKDAIKADAVLVGVRLFSENLPPFVVITGIGQYLKKEMDLSETPRHLPICPCTEVQVRNDPNFVKEGVSNSVVAFFHPGGVASYLSAPSIGTNAGQQCVYDAEGQIIIDVTYKGSKIVAGGGSADKYSPSISSLGHYYEDVLPWIYYCQQSGSREACSQYYKYRPSDPCYGYRPPTPSLATGDPRMKTFDGLSLMFNGVGEFILVEHADGKFVVQARMEQFESSNASVFTAFVIKLRSLVVQIQQSQAFKIDVLVNGYPVDFSYREVFRQTFNNELSIVAIDSDLSQLSVTLPSSGMSFVIAISQTEGVMSITSNSKDINKGKLRGLLGNFDGDAENDLQSRDGTTYDTRTATLADIHYKVGMSWVISASESLFSYPPGKSPSSYSNPAFVPFLEEPTVGTPIESCGSSIDCQIDVIATNGSAEVGNLTLVTEERFIEAQKIAQEQLVTCGIVDSLENGYVAYPSGILPGSLAHFECRSGFALEGSSTLECTQTGELTANWNGSIPSCQSIACQPIEEITNGKVSLSNGNFAGSSAQFTCDEGYVLNGAQTSFCISDKLPDCDSGYSLVDSAMLMCEGNEVALMSWDTPMPTCNQLTCPTIESPENGQVSMTNSTALGSMAQFTCHQGFYLSGTASLICSGSDTNSMEWLGDIPECLQLMCSPLENIDVKNGSITFTDGFRLDSIATLHCDEGFAANSSSTLLCTGADPSSMTWIGTFGSCLALTCPDIDAVENGHILFTNELLQGSSATLQCNPGYASESEVKLHCLGDSTSSMAWNGTFADCIALKCPPLDNQINGELFYTNELFHGSTATLACEPGFFATASTSLTCGGNDTSSMNWNGTIPSCDALTCTPLVNQSLNGYVSYSADLLFGSIATLHCDKGFAANSSATLVCSGTDPSTMTWNGTMGSCILLTCPSINTVDNGLVILSNGLLLGSVATLHCDNGYAAESSGTVQCDGNNVSSMAWSGQLPDCLPLSCPPIENPSNGKVDFTNGHLYNSVATLLCEPGYTTNTSMKTLICSGNDAPSMSWHGEFTDCVPVTCSSLEPPENGSVSLSNELNIDSVAKFTCDSDFSLLGLQFLICNATGGDSASWNGVPPTCLANPLPEAEAGLPWYILLVIAILGVILIAALAVLLVKLRKDFYFIVEITA